MFCFDIKIDRELCSVTQVKLAAPHKQDEVRNHGPLDIHARKP